MKTIKYLLVFCLLFVSCGQSTTDIDRLKALDKGMQNANPNNGEKYFKNEIPKPDKILTPSERSAFASSIELAIDESVTPFKNVSIIASGEDKSTLSLTADGIVKDDCILLSTTMVVKKAVFGGFKRFECVNRVSGYKVGLPIE